MVFSTTLRSRVEPTARPTSLSAVRSRLRACTSLNRRKFESADQVDLVLREGSDRAARQEEHANRRPLAHERNPQRGAETSALLRLEPSELRIGEDIRDMNRATLHHGSSSD